MMERADVARWLGDYVAAWKSYDPEAIGGLFAEDCVYRYRPQGDELRGRDAIVRSWREDEPDEQGTYDAAYEPYVVEGELAVAVGSSTYTNSDGSIRAIYDNCFLLRFDADGLCAEFTEFFMERKDAAGS
ncbi:MAG TPA: nuclear transport factor 2 family protein [Solirubrobacterales bacterium]|nr:nuclear transport factor 2 family protein [Solirubrobacterales bacterium]